MRRLRISTQPISMMRSPFFGSSPVVSVSRTTCLVIIGIPRYSLVRQTVRPLVLGVAGVTSYPMPFYVVDRGELIKPAPQIVVLHRLFVSGAPAAALPVIDPRRDAFLHVKRIGVKPYTARALERFERP